MILDANNVDSLSRKELEAVALFLTQERYDRIEAHRAKVQSAPTPQAKIPLTCAYEGVVVERWRSGCPNNVEAYSTRVCNHPDYPGLCRRQYTKAIDSILVVACEKCPLKEGVK